MARELSGQVIAPGELDEVYSNTAIDLGTRIVDDEGNEYIFMQGVASTIAGSVVTYDENKQTTLLVANAVGPCAVAMAAIVALKYGWYQIFGKALANMALSSADNALIGYESTSGYVGDGRAAGDIMYNAVSRSASGAAAELQNPIQIWYPWVDDQTAGH